jgi:predicted aspartyl protease
MIQRTVNDEHEAVIQIVVIGPKGQRRQIEAVVDTGFNGHLSLPASLIKKLGLPWRRRAIAELADGSRPRSCCEELVEDRSGAVSSAEIAAV